MSAPMASEIESTRQSDKKIALLTRDDVLVVAEAYRRAGRRAELIGTTGVIGGFALGAILLQANGIFHWSPALDPFLFLAGLTLAWTAAGLGWLRQRKLLANYQLRCPSCNAELLTMRPWRAEVSRVQLVANTGRCPSCGSAIVDTDES